MRAKNYWEKKMSTTGRAVFGNDIGAFSEIMAACDPAVETQGDVGKHVMFLVKAGKEVVLACAGGNHGQLREALLKYDNYMKNAPFAEKYPKFPDTIVDLVARVADWEKISKKSKEQADAEAGSAVIFESPLWVIRRIDTATASIYYGKGSGTGNGDAWCITTSGGEGHLRSYTENGFNPVYFIVHKKSKDKMFAIIPTQCNFSVEPRCQNKMNKFVGTKGIAEEVSEEAFKAMVADAVTWYDKKSAEKKKLDWTMFCGGQSAVTRPHDKEHPMIAEMIVDRMLSLIDSKKLDLSPSVDGLKFLPWILKNCSNKKMLEGVKSFRSYIITLYN